VSEKSACIDGHRKIGLETDHLKINKYSGLSDPSFKLVYPRILEMAQNAKEMVQRRLNPREIVRDNSGVQDKHLPCLQSLYLTNPTDDLADIRTSKGRRVDGTCEWLLVQEEYTTWLVKEGVQLLWLVGAPGIGKTMISTFLVDELEERARKLPGMTFAYYFCDNKNESRRTAEAIIRGLLLQLLRQHYDLIELIKPDFDLMKDKLWKDFHALWRNFVKILSHFKPGQVYLLVDALDECETRNALLQSLTSLLNSTQSVGTANVKFLITSRPADDIDRHLHRSHGYLQIDSAKVNNDLLNFIRVRVEELPESTYSKDLKEMVQDALVAKTGGTFLWVSLVLIDLKDCYDYEVEEKLSELPNDLNGIYDRILKNIKKGREEIARFVLWCTTVARRPLTVKELAMAYAVKFKMKSTNSIPSIKNLTDIFKSCVPLVYLNEKDQTVNLVHQSAKDYLLSEYLQRNGDLTRYRVVLHTANVLMFQICWKYLSVEEFDRGKTVISCDAGNVLQGIEIKHQYSLQRMHCFLEYSIKEWQEHAIAAYRGFLEGFEWECLALRDSPTLRDAWLGRAASVGHEAVVKVLLEMGKANVDSKDTESGWTPLSWAAMRGHEDVVRLLLEHKADVGVKDNGGQMALHLAAKEGHKTVVQLLLENGANANSEKEEEEEEEEEEQEKKAEKGWLRMLAIKKIRGRTALHLAAEKDRKEVVQLLLENGANVNAEEEEEKEQRGWREVITKGRTALHLAAEEGHKAVVQLLLENGANVSAQEMKKEKQKERRITAITTTRTITALHLAAREGHEAVVRLLLENGANVNAEEEEQEEGGRAALGGGIKITTTIRGRTALHLAAKEGHKAVVQLLLENGANVKAKEEGKVEMDSWRGRITTTRTRTTTALHLAARKGHDVVVQLLLESGVSVSVEEEAEEEKESREEGWRRRTKTIRTRGRTALNLAAKEGYKAVVLLLLENGANANAEEEEEEKEEKKEEWLGGGMTTTTRTRTTTALHIAAREGRKEVVQLLLKNSANVNAKGEEEEELWYSGGRTVKTMRTKGRTALHLAAREGHEAVALLLLENGASVDEEEEEEEEEANGKQAGGGTTTTIIRGRTALHLAVSRWHVAMVQLLLENGANVNVKGEQETKEEKNEWSGRGITTTTRIRGRTALHVAAEGWRIGAELQLLLESGADVNAEEEEEEQEEKKEGEKGWKRTVTTRRIKGRTALHLAARKGYKEMVQLLLENGANVNAVEYKEDVDAKTEYGETALHLATVKGHEEVVRLLLTFEVSDN
jgi:ankyrin repeat protein